MGEETAFSRCKAHVLHANSQGAGSLLAGFAARFAGRSSHPPAVESKHSPTAIDVTLQWLKTVSDTFSARMARTSSAWGKREHRTVQHLELPFAAHPAFKRNGQQRQGRGKASFPTWSFFRAPRGPQEGEAASGCSLRENGIDGWFAKWTSAGKHATSQWTL